MTGTIDDDDPLGATLLVAGDGTVLAKRRHGTSPGEAQDFDRAKRFAFAAVRFRGTVEEAAHQLIRAAKRPNKALVRAAPVPGLDTGRRHRRLLLPNPETGEAPTLREVPRAWAMFDFDDLPEPAGVDWRDDPAAAALAALDAALPGWLRGADYFAAYTGSHGFKPGMRLRSLHLLDAPLLGDDLRALLGAVPIDKSLTHPIQLHYTARPLFGNGVADPLPGAARFALASRRRRRAAVPPVPAPAPPPSPMPRTGTRWSGGPWSGGTTIGELIEEVKPQSAGGPGRNPGTITAAARFMRREGADADPEPLIAACIARAENFGASKAYLRRLAENARRFAAKCAANQRAEAAAGFAPISGGGDADRGGGTAGPPDQRAMRAQLGITFLDEETAS